MNNMRLASPALFYPSQFQIGINPSTLFNTSELQNLASTYQGIASSYSPQMNAPISNAFMAQPPQAALAMNQAQFANAYASGNPALAQGNLPGSLSTQFNQQVSNLLGNPPVAFNLGNALQQQIAFNPQQMAVLQNFAPAPYPPNSPQQSPLGQLGQIQGSLQAGGLLGGMQGTVSGLIQSGGPIMQSVMNTPQGPAVGSAPNADAANTGQYVDPNALFNAINKGQISQQDLNNLAVQQQIDPQTLQTLINNQLIDPMVLQGNNAIEPGRYVDPQQLFSAVQSHQITSQDILDLAASGQIDPQTTQTLIANHLLDPQALQQAINSPASDSPYVDPNELVNALMSGEINQADLMQLALNGMIDPDTLNQLVEAGYINPNAAQSTGASSSAPSQQQQASGSSSNSSGGSSPWLAFGLSTGMGLLMMSPMIYGGAKALGRGIAKAGRGIVNMFKSKAYKKVGDAPSLQTPKGPKTIFAGEISGAGRSSSISRLPEERLPLLQNDALAQESATRATTESERLGKWSERTWDEPEILQRELASTQESLARGMAKTEAELAQSLKGLGRKIP